MNNSYFRLAIAAYDFRGDVVSYTFKFDDEYDAREIIRVARQATELRERGEDNEDYLDFIDANGMVIFGEITFTDSDGRKYRVLPPSITSLDYAGFLLYHNRRLIDWHADQNARIFFNDFHHANLKK